ncbi:MAG: outer membrane protein [Cellvibrionaceae bacterium]
MTIILTVANTSTEVSNPIFFEPKTIMRSIGIGNSLLALVWAIISASSPLASAESLLEVYELALQNDLQYKADLAAYQADVEAENISRGVLLPQINFSSRYDNDDSDTEVTSYSLNLQQAIIDYNAIYNYRSGKIRTQIAEVQLAADKQALIIRSATTYFDVLGKLDQLRTSEAEEKALFTQLEQVRQRFEVGLVPINDVQEIRAAYDSARADRLGDELNVITAFEALTILTGKDHRSIAPLDGSFLGSAPQPNNKENWIAAAKKNNLTLQVNELTVETLRFDAKAAGANRYPKLTGRLSYSDTNTDTAENTGDIDADGTSVQLNLNIPLYTGGNLSALQRQAEQNQVRAREEFLFAQRNTIQRTRQLFFSVNNDIEQIKARKQAIVSSESALEATQAGYEAGTRDIVDVVNAQSNLFEAQRNYFNALYGYILDSLNLKNESGSLSVKDLQELEKDLLKDKLVERI